MFERVGLGNLHYVGAHVVKSAENFVLQCSHRMGLAFHTIAESFGGESRRPPRTQAAYRGLSLFRPRALRVLEGYKLSTCSLSRNLVTMTYALFGVTS